MVVELCPKGRRCMGMTVIYCLDPSKQKLNAKAEHITSHSTENQKEKPMSFHLVSTHPYVIFDQSYFKPIILYYVPFALSYNS